MNNCENELSITKNVPVAGEYDIVVCGGGPSGWTAAVAAARNGMKTAIVERFGFFGGAATAGLVVPISAFFKNGERVIGGIGWEFIGLLQEKNAARIELPKGHISVDPEYYKLISEKLVLDAGAQIYANSYISGLRCSSGHIEALIIENKNGTEALRGKYFIDATGDGDAAAMAGVPMRINADPQPISLCFSLSGVDISTELLRDYVHHDGKNRTASVHEGIHELLNSYFEKSGDICFGGPWFNVLMRGSEIAVNVTRSSANALDNRAYCAAEAKLRRTAFEIVELLREKYPEFRYCHITQTAVNAGVREGRHLIGRHTLTGEELMEGVKFPDTVALSAHPIDIHKTDGSGQILLPTKHIGCIPYSSMICDECDNLIVTGRAISADDTAHASTRIQGPCMALGEAAGTAAAICAEQGISVGAINAAVLRNRLLAQGAVL